MTTKTTLSQCPYMFLGTWPSCVGNGFGSTGITSLLPLYIWRITMVLALNYSWFGIRLATETVAYYLLSITITFFNTVFRKATCIQYVLAYWTKRSFIIIISLLQDKSVPFFTWTLGMYSVFEPFFSWRINSRLPKYKISLYAKFGKL